MAKLLCLFSSPNEQNDPRPQHQLSDVIRVGSARRWTEISGSCGSLRFARDNNFPATNFSIKHSMTMMMLRVESFGAFVDAVRSSLPVFHSLEFSLFGVARKFHITSIFTSDPSRRACAVLRFEILLCSAGWWCDFESKNFFLAW